MNRDEEYLFHILVKVDIIAQGYIINAFIDSDENFFCFNKVILREIAVAMYCIMTDLRLDKLLNWVKSGGRCQDFAVNFSFSFSF